MSDARGAYGFRIEGKLLEGASLAAVPHNWPRLVVERIPRDATNPRPAGTVIVQEHEATVWLPDGDRIECRRDPLTVRFATQEPYRPEAILHPFLGLPAAICALWSHRYVLHGGAFALHGRAVALLGDREAGKSATLAGLMGAGHPILSDDILIFDGTTLFAGPRSIDLREEAARSLGGERLGLVGNRTRWRLRPVQAPASLPLAAVVHLAWGDTTSLRRLSAGEHLQALVNGSAFRPTPAAARGLLELAAMPGWRFTRPRRLELLADLCDQLVSGLPAKL